MKTKKKSIDDMIKDALAEEDAEISKNFEDESILHMMTSTFMGKLKWIAILSAVIMLILFAFSVYCAIQFFKVSELREMMVWGAGAFLGMMAVGLLKTWHWMQIDKNSIMREIKRQELQIALLAKKLS